MRLVRMGLVALAVACWPAPGAHAGIGLSVGVRLGVPCWGPCWGPRYCYGPCYGPVLVAPAPVVVQPVAVAQPAYVAPAPPPQVVPSVQPAPTAVRAARAEEPGGSLSDLKSPDERTRARAALELGRHKDSRAIEPLGQALREDASASVREAAARGLGLIGSPSSLEALQQAAQADDDRDVRRSASFAAEVIRANLRAR
jgi:hypothetical protein